jgi:hypothetical protein
MDDEMMHRWIYHVLIPWRNTTWSGVVPLLIHNAYGIHMMGTVADQIQSLRIEVVNIPLGWTYVCQPVEIWINKTIQCGMQKKWENWMLEGEMIADWAAKETPGQFVAELFLDVYTSIPGQMVRNAWMKTGFGWF